MEHLLEKQEKEGHSTQKKPPGQKSGGFEEPWSGGTSHRLIWPEQKLRVRISMPRVPPSQRIATSLATTFGDTETGRFSLIASVSGTRKIQAIPGSAQFTQKCRSKEGVFQAEVKAWPKAPGCEKTEKLQLFTEKVIAARVWSTHWCQPQA